MDTWTARPKALGSLLGYLFGPGGPETRDDGSQLALRRTWPEAPADNVYVFEDLEPGEYGSVEIWSKSMEPLGPLTHTITPAPDHVSSGALDLAPDASPDFGRYVSRVERERIDAIDWRDRLGFPGDDS